MERDNSVSPGGLPRRQNYGGNIGGSVIAPGRLNGVSAADVLRLGVGESAVSMPALNRPMLGADITPQRSAAAVAADAAAQVLQTPGGDNERKQALQTLSDAGRATP